MWRGVADDSSPQPVGWEVLGGYMGLLFPSPFVAMRRVEQTNSKAAQRCLTVFTLCIFWTMQVSCFWVFEARCQSLDHTCSHQLPQRLPRSQILFSRLGDNFLFCLKRTAARLEAHGNEKCKRESREADTGTCFLALHSCSFNSATRAFFHGAWRRFCSSGCLPIPWDYCLVHSFFCIFRCNDPQFTLFALTM